jgi:HD-like signal output (HDOD) protein
VLFRFLGLVGSPETTTEDLVQFIWKDPALLARVLPLSSGKSGIRDGIAALGRQRIRDIAFTTPLLRSFDPLTTASSAVTLWERALVCATACEATAGFLKLQAPERYYIAGMLRDIGYVVLLQKRPGILPAIIERSAGHPAQLLEIEEALVGADHCQIGARAVEQLGLGRWLLPAIAPQRHVDDEVELLGPIAAVGAAFASHQGLDVVAGRSLSRSAQERQMLDTISVLLPALKPSQRTALVETISQAIRPAQEAIHDTIVDWQVAGQSRLQPCFVRAGSGGILRATA